MTLDDDRPLDDETKAETARRLLRQCVTGTKTTPGLAQMHVRIRGRFRSYGPHLTAEQRAAFKSKLIREHELTLTQIDAVSGVEETDWDFLPDDPWTDD
jgi:hypothetical protein